MARWWMGLALGGMLAAAGQAPAQAPPHDGGAAPMAEPTPILPPIYQGKPLQGTSIPPQPADAVSHNVLPPDLPTAWDEGPGWKHAVYAYVGSLALQRQRMGRSALALQDPSDVDTGLPPAPDAPVAASFADIVPNYNWGVTATLGYHWKTYAFELTGFYLPENESAKTTTQPGRLDTFFFNFPLGFEGNNTLFLHADQITQSLKTTLASGEANFRVWPGYTYTVNALFGLRYLDLQENLGIIIDDEGLSAPDFLGRPDPTRVAVYQVRAHNRILAFQAGVEWSQPIHHSCFAMTWQFKGAWGANWVDTEGILTRGDGLIGRAGKNPQETVFSHLYEFGVFVDWSILPQMRLRGGYNCLLVADVVEAVQGVSYNLEVPVLPVSNDGTIFYHGPSFELRIVF